MKRQLLLSVVCVAAALLVLLWGFGQGAPAVPPPPEAYWLVIEDDTGTFLMQLRKGMRQAVDEQDARLEVAGEEGLDGAETVTAALLLMEEPERWLKRHGEEAGFPLLVIGREIAGYPCVTTDDEKAAVRLAERAKSMAAGGRTALILDDEDDRAALRSQAARTWAGEHEVAVLSYGEDGLRLPEGCRAVAAMGRRSTSALAGLKRTGAYTGAVLGVDTGDSRVADLESGAVDVMALDNPYAMGYLALAEAKQASAGDVSPKTIRVEALLADRENMYLPENVKQVFPLLQ